MIIESTISGIPCKIQVDTYHHQKPNHSSWDSDWDYYGYTEIEFSVLDRKGYKAAWLERKLTDNDIERIEIEIQEAYETLEPYIDIVHRIL